MGRQSRLTMNGVPASECAIAICRSCITADTIASCGARCIVRLRTRASALGVQAGMETTPRSSIDIPSIASRRRPSFSVIAILPRCPLVPQMAQSPDEVWWRFLHDLGRRSRPYAKRDYAELTAFAREALASRSGRAWIWAYAAEKHKASRGLCILRAGICAPYYSRRPRVEGTLSRGRDDLRGDEFRGCKRPRGGTRVFDLFEMRDRDGGLVGQFVISISMRGLVKQMRRRGWTMRSIGSVSTAVYQPSRCVHDVQSVAAYVGQAGDVHAPRSDHAFHEFGHGPASAVTRVDVAGVSGIQGVEWDARRAAIADSWSICWSGRCSNR
jgi:oligopeptidase A